MMRRLQELGCDTAQGWHFADALPVAELEDWLDDEANVWEPEREEMQVTSENPRLREARDLIEKTASGLGYDADAIWDMKLAATEALVNAIEHGVPGEDGVVHLRLTRKRGDLVVEVWGGGAEDSTQIRHGDDNRGRGIAIMTALMDEVELKRNPEASRILLAKRGPAAD